MKLFRVLPLLLCWLCIVCNPSGTPDVPGAADPHSYARPSEAVVKHLDLDLAVDFDARVLRGTAVLEIGRNGRATTIVLDTRHLDVSQVWTSSDSTTLRPADFTWGESDSLLGTPLEIALRRDTRYVHIAYATRPEAEALQFLPASLTSGRHPFLLTQSQAIHARSWVPIQDSPGIRFTYHARIQTSPALLALMSADNPVQKNDSGIYTFSMTQAIPAYLLALAVGDIGFAPLGPRSGVYAEPALLEDAAYEFAEVEKMIQVAEGLYGPYRWGRYDILVLPPSFPFGGMENPRLTFATPTILAGDRTLVSLIAHELAHSWSGNLVTNATWNDFWLNEGFTVYIENRIMEALAGKDYADMLAVISREDLRQEISAFWAEGDTQLTTLKLDLAGQDPDEGMSSIAYDKGYYFLRLIEEQVGREVFDPFLRRYFNDYAFQTMTTEAFEAILYQQLLDARPGLADQIDVKTWLYAPGIPSNMPQVQARRYLAVEDAMATWAAGVPPADLPTTDWTTYEWLYFLRMLPATVKPEQLAQLDAAFRFTRSSNSEIQCAWFLCAIRAGYSEAYPALRQFLMRVGRRKFLTPLYKQLLQTETGAVLARDIYGQARERYHPIAVQSLDKLLGTW
ncbi:MAG: M1 family metallopeptidase [Bacteroidia bacterium]